MNSKVDFYWTCVCVLFNPHNYKDVVNSIVKYLVRSISHELIVGYEALEDITLQVKGWKINDQNKENSGVCCPDVDEVMSLKLLVVASK